MQYSTIPGRYFYPQAEGQFVVDEESDYQYVHSMPNLAGTTYYHKNV